MRQAEDRLDRQGIVAPPARPRSRLMFDVALGGGAVLATFSAMSLGRGATLLGAAGMIAGLALLGWALVRRWRCRTSPIDAFSLLVADDPLPTYVTDRAGRLLSINRAASLRQPAREPLLAAQLGSLLAEPERLIDRLTAELDRTGQAREEMVTRRGPLLVSAVRLGRDAVAWRVDTQEGRGGRAADALSLPMLTAGPGGTVLFLNEAFRRLLGARPRHVESVFVDLPIQPGAVQKIRGAAGAVDGLVAQVEGPGGRREIYVLPPTSAVPPLPADVWRIEDIPLPILHLSTEGVIEGVSDEGRALLPMPIEPGMRLSDLLEGQGRAVADWVADVAGGRPSQGPQVLRGRGEHQDFCLRVALSLVGRPGARQLVAVLSDVSELKKLEGQFVQSQKMQALGQLAGGVAHDFNNVLTAILGHCDLLMLRHVEGDGDHADLVQVRQNAERAAALVAQLLAFSRKQSLVLEPLDLRDAFGDLDQLLARLVGERVRVAFRHDEKLHLVRADRRQLEQVVMNLVVNARDAMPDGGTVVVETSNRALAAPLQRDRATVPPGRYVLIRVTDEGTGIPPDRLTKIFDPFYTTKKAGEGTGLGLSTVYGIVKQTGGFIFVDSTLGEGTTFTIWLPSHGPTAAARLRPEVGLATIGGTERPSAGGGAEARIVLERPAAPPQVTPPQPAGAPPAAQAQGAGRLSTPGVAALLSPTGAPAEDRPVATGLGSSAGRAEAGAADSRPDAASAGAVLLVEDEAPVRAFASRALRLSGFDVMEADSAESALAHLADPAIRIDCVVSDVIMPGKDGPTWVREALVARPDLRVVFVSGYAEETFAEQRSSLPGAAFLPKPFSLAELTRAVRAQVSLAGDEDSEIASEAGTGTRRPAAGGDSEVVSPTLARLAGTGATATLSGAEDEPAARDASVPVPDVVVLPDFLRREMRQAPS